MSLRRWLKTCLKSSLSLMLAPIAMAILRSNTPIYKMLSINPLHNFKNRRVRWKPLNKGSINRILKIDRQRRKRNHGWRELLFPKKHRSRIAAFTSNSTQTPLFSELMSFEIEHLPEAIYLAPIKSRRNHFEHPLRTRQEAAQSDLSFTINHFQIVYNYLHASF